MTNAPYLAGRVSSSTPSPARAKHRHLELQSVPPGSWPAGWDQSVRRGQPAASLTVSHYTTCCKLWVPPKSRLPQRLRVQNWAGTGLATVRLDMRHVRPDATPQETKEAAFSFFFPQGKILTVFGHIEKMLAANRDQRQAEEECLAGLGS